MGRTAERRRPTPLRNRELRGRGGAAKKRSGPQGSPRWTGTTLWARSMKRAGSAVGTGGIRFGSLARRDSIAVEGIGELGHGRVLVVGTRLNLTVGVAEEVLVVLRVVRVVSRVGIGCLDVSFVDIEERSVLLDRLTGDGVIRDGLLREHLLVLRVADAPDGA